MFSPRQQRLLLISLGVSGGLAACLLAAALGWGVAFTYQAADYPGALPMADHSLYRWTPALHWRRDTSYRSTAEFPELYNWYSQRFGLGPEARAESACITMQKADRVFILERLTTVMICDTGPDRLVFVTRAFTVRLR